MDIETHHSEFQKVIKKYGLFLEHKAGKVADYLTSEHGKDVHPKHFAEEFGMDENEAKTFLTFIEKGIHFKKSAMDKK